MPPCITLQVSAGKSN